MSNEAQIQLNNTVTMKEVTIEEARQYEQKRFAHRYRTRRLDKFEKAFARRLCQMVGSEGHIVDVPCGSGRFFDIFSKAKSLTMIDYSAGMLKTVEERYGIAENVRMIQADIASLPLDDNSADLCFCMRLFHHMKDDQTRSGALKELARVSKKYVALSFYNKNCLRFYWRKTLGKKIRGNYVTFGHIVNLAEQTGLEPVRRLPKLNLTEQQCLIIFKKV